MVHPPPRRHRCCGHLDASIWRLACQHSSFFPVQQLPTVISLSRLNHRNFIPNYGERYRCGEAIAAGFVESTVNQIVRKRFCKKQQMQWSKRGAHLLLQTRVKILNGELGSVEFIPLSFWYDAPLISQ